MDEPTAKILVVDDEKTNIDVLVGLLNSHYRTVVAKDGPQALKRARSDQPPDLILLDIMMPKMDGFEVCQRLKEDKATARIPVIFVTGMDDPKDETRGLESGAVDFIRKPFNPKVVLARVNTHMAIQKQKEKLVELNDMKNRFLGMAAHDLRNPLSAICGLSEMLLQMELPEADRRKFITTIRGAGKQMLNLINDLLDVSVIESGKFDLDLRPEDLAKLAKERVGLVRLLAEKKEITLVSELQETPPTFFDTDRIAQVLDNLLSNAIKFSPLGSQITVRTETQEGLVCFQVSDQGPGIPEKEQNKLFGEFQKLSVRPTGNEKSTGLGLSIVKKMVDAHQGSITVESQVGKGSTFTLALKIGGPSV
ncbi:MAG: hybrid sensor histidine kinase/response regulator [Magnetococcales bacterium]|nr:hybrid sensor histidine kinase/response regulator [Magnetococcales bacterium]